MGKLESGSEGDAMDIDKYKQKGAPSDANVTEKEGDTKRESEQGEGGKNQSSTMVKRPRTGESQGGIS